MSSREATGFGIQVAGLVVPWRILAAVGMLSLLLAFLYDPVLRFLVWQWWNDPDASHGFLIPALSLYFAWERRQRLADMKVQPSLWGLMVLLGGLGFLLFGTVGAELFVMRTSLIIVIAGLILFLMGKEAMRILSFPVLFLFFMIPLPAIVLNMVAFPLQMFAAKTATYCLLAAAIPVLREGNLIMLAHTTLEVAQACSGLRSLMALMALGVVFAYFSQTVLWKRLVLVASSVPIAIGANAFRVTGTGALAHYFGPGVADGFYHTFSGMVIFGVALTALLMEGWLLSMITRRAVR